MRPRGGDQTPRQLLQRRRPDTQSRPNSNQPCLSGASVLADVVLSRADSGGKTRQLITRIMDRLTSNNSYDVTEVNELLDLIVGLEPPEQRTILHDLPGEFYRLIAQEPFDDKLGSFLKSYGEFVPGAVHTFSYAETVASNMKEVFHLARSDRDRAKALELAVEGAIQANRFAAMDTCTAMIYSVDNDDLGLLVADTSRIRSA